MNGRSGHDKDGNFTSIQPNGNSITDYALCSPGIFGSIEGFKVHNKVPESDHVPITFSIKCNMIAQNITDARTVKWDSAYKYLWDPEGLSKLKGTLSDRQSNSFYEQFISSISNLECASIVGKKYSEYIQNALDKCFKKKQVKLKIGKPTW